ncbi:uncharacterized protein LOC135224711 isoform X2 [Macrobrachium nipponense]|uniref:uncharacterized protein LOC135224711 isoform X2 n=1 Tax=Macrobrachium nipponense TaxID=159736 RepID=UPI0030C8468A
MAFFGAISCSTSIGQTVVFGLISASVSSLCSVDESVCCTCTTVVYRMNSYETEIVEDTVTPPFILTTLFPWLFGVRRRYYNDDDDRSGGGRSRRLPRARFRRDSDESNITTQESCDCSFSRTFQFFLGAFFLASLPNLVASCIVPATPVTNVPPQTPQIIFPQLPPRPEPVTPLIPFLLPGDRGPAFHKLENLEADGCPRAEVLIEGTCAKLLDSAPPCPPPEWIVLNATTNPLQGTCGTRLCGRGRVFLVSDQLCHDVREPGICPVGKRLYVTAFGSPVCDCFDGEIPDDEGVCHPIMSQGPCSAGEMWGPDLKSFSFKCQPRLCPPHETEFHGRPRGHVLFDGRCHSLGSEVPCELGEVLGFSLSRLKAVCTTLKETSIIGPNIDNVPRGVHAPPVPPLQSCPPDQCFNDMAKCVSCNQALVDTCVLSATIRLQQTSCQALATGLG